MFENVILAFQGIWSHKLRSLLTMLGIIIGIASIIAIVSTIKGTNEQIKQNLIGSGNNVVEVQLSSNGSTVDVEYDTPPSGLPDITESALGLIKALDSVETASAYNKRSYADSVYFRSTSYTGTIIGADWCYLKTYGYQVTQGRPFSQRDYDDYHKVALVDETAVKTLFADVNPIGQTIEIKKEPFTVLGVVRLDSQSQPVINSYSDYSTYNSNSSGKIIIPDCVWAEVYAYDEPKSVAVRATSTDDMTKAGKKSAELLSKRLPASLSNTYSYQSADLAEAAKNLQELANTSNKQLVWIASISLLVGGIGVMNIMLVSVTERTREIGLKKALGAKKGRILFQFLTEASVLTSFGGVLGVLLGIGMARIIGSLTGTPTAISVPAILIAVLFSMAIGVVFGLMPAVKAANLNPIDALRRE